MGCSQGWWRWECVLLHGHHLGVYLCTHYVCRVSRVMLVIPHSNTSEGRIIILARFERIIQTWSWAQWNKLGNKDPCESLRLANKAYPSKHVIIRFFPLSILSQLGGVVQQFMLAIGYLASYISLGSSVAWWAYTALHKQEPSGCKTTPPLGGTQAPFTILLSRHH